ncbi:hypothetical protein D3C76_1000490 [compost metagenome]
MREMSRPSGEAWKARANFSSDTCSNCWVSLSWVISRTTTTSAGVSSRSMAWAEIRPVKVSPLARRKGISRLCNALPCCRRWRSVGPMPGMPQMSRSVAVLPRASLVLMPICCSKVWLIASRQPSV